MCRSLERFNLEVASSFTSDVNQSLALLSRVSLFRLVAESYGCDMIMVYKATPRTVAPFD